MLKEGQMAPEFSLPDANNNRVSLADFKGKNVVLYFYPRDNTGGCTKEALSFKENFPALQEAGAVVIGVSPDSIASHQKFIAKYDLPFILLSDPEREVSGLYGAYGEKKMCGKTTLGIIRSTFIINGEGVIVKVYPKVKPEGHGEEVLRFFS
jgi:peroxiredoxin Q/BCP